MRKRDLRLLNEMVQQAQNSGIHYYIAERDRQYGKSLSGKIESAIRNCDCFVALWTKSGANSKYVNQEIGLAKGFGKLRIIVAEEGVDFVGFDIDNERVVFYRGRPFETIGDLNTYLSSLKEKKEFVTALGLFLLAILGLVFFLISLNKGKESSTQQSSLPAKSLGRKLL
ncbi:MAG: toll/interleukin-1 receptor domain-containing protein [candidate division Zixibacteria bacterium]|nr:toll/interleukin-1 receptor domain-containing protein [candidate division Zixibacteria bacterium]